MQDSAIKTSKKQRIIILIVAFILLFSSVAIYVAIIASRGSSEKSKADMSALLAEYTEKNKELESASTEYSSKNLEAMIENKSNVKAFNATSANESLKIEDIKEGTGKELTSDSEGYAAFYIGWCSNEKVFDSSFDSYESPSKLKSPLIVEKGSLIEGWYQGVNGMKIGGVRIVTIPGNLAYGESYNPCDQNSEEKNVPLKFLIMPIEVSDDFKKISKEANDAYMKYVYAQYGIEYGE